MPVAAPTMNAARTLASRIMRATGSVDAGSGAARGQNAMDWADMLEEFNRRNVGLGANPNPFETYMGPVPAARLAVAAPVKQTAQQLYESQAKSSAFGPIRPVSPSFKPAVRIKLRPEAIEAIGKFLRTMRPGGTMPFNETVARDTVLRIIRYYHPQIEGLGSLGSWLSDAVKGKDSPLTKIVAVAAPIVGGVVGGPAGAAAGAAIGGFLSKGQQQSAGQQVAAQQGAPQPAAAPLNPFATLGPVLPSVAPLMSQPQTQPQPTYIVTGGDDGWKKYIPLMVGGGIGLLVLTLVLKK